MIVIFRPIKPTVCWSFLELSKMLVLCDPSQNVHLKVHIIQGLMNLLKINWFGHVRYTCTTLCMLQVVTQSQTTCLGDLD